MSIDSTSSAVVEPEAVGSGVAYRLRYQEQFEFAPDVRLVTDNQGVILEVNHAAARFLANRKEFLVGKPLGLLIVESQRARFYQSLIRLMKTDGSDEFDARIGLPRTEREVAWKVTRGGPPSEDATLCWFLLDITEQKRAVAGRADLIRRLVTAQEDERRRVARELHDSVGQLLSALLLAVRSVRDGEALTASVLTRLEVVEQIADELGRTTHDLAVRLRPTALDDFGLQVALQALITDWSHRTRVDVHFQPIGLESIRLATEVETTLYRVVQEALTNITKHADARLVSVVVERRLDDTLLLIEDDGIGFDPNSLTLTRRLGLLGMQERVTLVDGEFHVETAPTAGTLIRVRVPIRPIDPEV